MTIYERRNRRPRQLGIVLFITRGPWWRVHVGSARSERGWFWSATIGRLKLNLERRTLMGFDAESHAAEIVRAAASR